MIYVFICESEELSRKLLKEHFERDRITYAEVFENSQRESVVEVLGNVQRET